MMKKESWSTQLYDPASSLASPQIFSKKSMLWVLKQMQGDLSRDLISSSPSPYQAISVLLAPYVIKKFGLKKRRNKAFF